MASLDFDCCGCRGKPQTMRQNTAPVKTQARSPVAQCVHCAILCLAARCKACAAL